MSVIMGSSVTALVRGGNEATCLEFTIHKVHRGLINAGVVVASCTILTGGGTGGFRCLFCVLFVFVLRIFAPLQRSDYKSCETEFICLFLHLLFSPSIQCASCSQNGRKCVLCFCFCCERLYTPLICKV